MRKFGKGSLLRSTVLAGFAATAFAATPALAQEADEDEDEDELVEIETQEPTSTAEGDRIVVTGSRIARTTQQPVPLTTIGEEQFEVRGFTNALEALTELPSVTSGSTRFGANDQFGANNAFVDILGLGSNRTLTLVDGRRFVGANQATLFVPDNISGSQVDLTVINPGLIERVEVVTGAGGAVYGADAVAGVNNIILKRDYEGAEITVQGGITYVGDGEEYRASGLWGRNFLDDRLNVTLAAEYFDSSLVRNGGERDIQAAGFSEFNNPLSFTSTDGIPNTVFASGYVNTFANMNGIVNFGQVTSGGSTGDFFFPNKLADAASNAAYNNFVAATGLTPWQYALSPNLSGINPLAFVGTFGLFSSHLTVPNTDPATSGILPQVAVPLQFDGNGNLVAFDMGDLLPPTLADQNSSRGGDGFFWPELGNLRSAQERISLNALFTFDVTNNIRYKGDFLYTEIENVSQDSVGSNQQAGGNTSGSRGLPIFIDQNPFVSAQAVGVLNNIEAANGGSYFETIGGQRVIYLGRNLNDLSGGLANTSGGTSETFRTSHTLEGNFEFLNRDFFWDVSAVYGHNKTFNEGELDFRDIEFALATDVVTDASGNVVCRQQTLAAPEAINVRNPRLAFINGTQGLVPTQAQIDACVPLNLLGEGSASQAAIDYVTGRNNSENESTQLYLASSLGGDVVDLPAGTVRFNLQGEYREEELTFTVNEFFGTGAGRSTIGQNASGVLEFVEIGGELFIPIFGGDFTPIPYGMEELDLSLAARNVERSGEGDDPLNPGSRVESDTTEDSIVTAGLTWRPIDDLQIRGTYNTSVRSATVVELFGAPQTGFTGAAQWFACNGFFGNGGPATRQTNCAAFAASQGTTAAAFLSLLPPAGSLPAAVASNPNLANEQAETYIAGFTYEPSFLENFTISSDYIWFELQGELDLVFPPLLCFDDENFPNSVVNSVAVCENTVLSIEDPNNPGNFIVPSINPITGNPVPAIAQPGSPSAVQAPYTLTFANFANGNLGGRRLEAINTTIRYNFEVANVVNPIAGHVGDIFGRDFGGIGDRLGDIFLNAEVFYLVESQTSASGNFGADVNELKGEPGSAEWVSNVSLTHTIGDFYQVVQWFHTASTVDDISETNPGDQPADFFNPSTDIWNYNIGYEFNDRLRARFTINNVTNEGERPEIGISSGLGRNYVASITATF
ncbi:MAG: TonB-dependent receptor plug domain-containing protein [Oceanicaulis sp.]